MLTSVLSGKSLMKPRKMSASNALLSPLTISPMILSCDLLKNIKSDITLSRVIWTN